MAVSRQWLAGLHGPCLRDLEFWMFMQISNRGQGAATPEHVRVPPERPPGRGPADSESLSAGVAKLLRPRRPGLPPGWLLAGALAIFFLMKLALLNQEPVTGSAHHQQQLPTKSPPGPNRHRIAKSVFFLEPAPAGVTVARADSDLATTRLSGSKCLMNNLQVQGN